ncbi:MAG: tRNA (N6-threonylcarbamoyladenosine(37)-N6)-methyltransferase TrmO, partial [Deltaproteobacteria bacterium]|nr:tRNA (N6-threonylcarbamoyladenosine(37)-N6)-methyltransferase TrmO [Deltaproteobacteria bacterium]
MALAGKKAAGDSRQDFALTPIGVIRSPFKGTKEAPQQGRGRGEVGEIEVFAEFEEGLRDIEGCTHLILIFWMDRARRDLLLARPPHEGKVHGVFATRSPH